MTASTEGAAGVGAFHDQSDEVTYLFKLRDILRIIEVQALPNL